MSIRVVGKYGFSRPPMVKIYDNTLAAAGRFDVTGIPPNFTGLKLVLSNARSDDGSVADLLYLLLNGDTTQANYYYTRLSANASSLTAVDAANSLIGVVPGDTATLIDNMEINIWNYNTSTHKMSYSVNTLRRSDVAETAIEQFSLAWENVAVVNQITIQPDGYAADELTAGSRLQIWGIY